MKSNKYAFRDIKNAKVKKKLIKLLDPEKMERIENDVTFNYSATEFKFKGNTQ